MNNAIKKFNLAIKFIFIYLIITLLILSATGNVKVIDFTKSQGSIFRFQNLQDDYTGKINGTYVSEIKAKRGRILDSKGRVLAYDANVYDIYFVVGNKDEKYNFKNDTQVVEKLAPILNTDANTLLNLLNKDKNNLYQFEIGQLGKNLYPDQKEAIEELQISGIGFTQKYVRQYSNSYFAPHIIGYARESETKLANGNIILETNGEMGIEKQYNEILKGKNGQKTGVYINGRIAPGTTEKIEPAIDGIDIQLTLNLEAQLMTEQVMKNLQDEQQPEWAQAIIANANTGEIVAATSTPNYNLNTRDGLNFQSPLYSTVFEPGSTFKTFTWASAIENGTYEAEEKYQTGKIQVEDVIIADHNEGKGWGKITYDQGFKVSSNTGAVELASKKLGYDNLKTKIDELKFGEPVTNGLPNQSNGKIEFTTNVDKASVSFGQAILVNGMQLTRAATAIYSNDGKMSEPMLVQKIGDQKIEPTRSDKIIYNQTTRDKVKDLAKKTVQDNSDGFAFGGNYNLDDYNVYGKTGTGQQINETTKKYDFSRKNFVYSFLGYLPNSNNDYVFYMAVKGPIGNYDHSVQGTYYKKIARGILADQNGDRKENSQIVGNNSQLMVSLINQNINNVKENFKTNPLQKIGEEEQIIAQYPEPNNMIAGDEKIIVVTPDKNGNPIIPDFTNLTTRQVTSICGQLRLDCELVNSGKVVNQSIASYTVITNENRTIRIEFNKEE